MILILASPADVSVNKVINHLTTKNVSFVRVSDLGESLDVKCNLQHDILSSEFILEYKSEKISLSEIDSVWFRGGDVFNVEKLSTLEFKSSVDLSKQSRTFLQWEWQSLNSWCFKRLMSKKHLGNPFCYDINKLLVLDTARKSGLIIPKTRILSKRTDIIEFFEECNEQLISKAIFNSFNFLNNGKVYAHPTLKVERRYIESLPNRIGPSLFQKLVDKQVDLRCCFMNGNFYCGAIFSQNDDITRVDFRNYDSQKPNRIVPFRLPYSVKSKLSHLMKGLNLNFGQLDLILDKNNHYYFLEVNPLGQFDWLSVNCGFNIDELIAHYLIDGKNS